MVIVPEIMWHALLQNEYRVHGMDVAQASEIRPPLATWKTQGTGVCFRNDTIPAFPLWEADDNSEDARTVRLDQLSPATLSDEPPTHYPPVKIEPLQSPRMCICKVFDNEDFDSRRSARVLAVDDEPVISRSHSENELRAADAFRLSHDGALPKVGHVMRF